MLLFRYATSEHQVAFPEERADIDCYTKIDENTDNIKHEEGLQIMGILFLTLAIAFNSVANGFFKAGSGIETLTMRKGMLLGLGLLIGLANTICYIKALEKIDLAIAYSVFSAASIMLIAIISLVFFKEPISVQKTAGLAVICVGILLTWKA